RALDWEFDDLMLEPGKMVRCVTLAAPSSRAVVLPWWPGPTAPASKGGRQWDRGARPAEQKPAESQPRNGSNPPPPPPPQPTIVGQCACAGDRIDAALAEFKARRDADMARLDQATTAMLADLRGRLLLISGACFAAAAAGGFFLVRLGLAPIERLSDAVRQVSPKDFRLPLGPGERLPVELRPIAGRLEQTLDMLKRVFAREKQAAADLSHELR